MKKLLYIALICLIGISFSSCEKDELDDCNGSNPEMKAIELDDKDKNPTVQGLQSDKVKPNPRENGDSGVNDDGDDESGNPPAVKAK
jgi:hypothetical protein